MVTPRNRRGIRALTVAAILMAAVGVVWTVASAGNGERRLHATVSEAAYVRSGTQVRIAGQVVGSVASAEPTRDGRARLQLQIDDKTVWPVPRGTKLRLRWLSSIAFTGRYVELDPPTETNSGIPNGGKIAAADVGSSVEFDQLFRTFDRDTRRDLRSTLKEGGSALGHADDELRRTLEATPAAIKQANAVLDDLGAESEALETLVQSTDRVLDAADRADPGTGTLISEASTTFRAVASRSRELQQALSATPRTLRSVRRSLARGETVLLALDELAGRMSPGIAEVRATAPPLASLLETAVDVSPLAGRTVRALRHATPDLDALLERTRTVMPRMESAGRQASRQLACIRPYAPEIAGVLSTWSGFLGHGDKLDKFARVMYPALGFGATRQSSGEVAAQLPYLTFGFPRSPGDAVGQPWFLEHCGAGEDSINPDRDPEAPR